MTGRHLFTGTSRQMLMGWLLLAALLVIVSGCSATRPTPTPEQTAEEGIAFCAKSANGEPPQIAPDDCLKEVCREGRLEHVEELRETATVRDWAEEGFCFLQPIDCTRALSIKNHVLQWEQEKAKAGLWDRASLQSGLGDAARHAYLACLLAERFGEAFAKGLLEAHEEDSTVMFGFGIPVKGNRCCDKVMDLHNNRIGMELAAQPGDCEEKALKSLPRLRHSLCAK